MAPPDKYPIQKAAAALEIVGIGAPNPSSPHGPDEWIRRLATLPLMHQPGEKWMYNSSRVDTMLGGVCIAADSAVLAGMFRRIIFEPLGMKDTGFSVPAAKLDRLATSYMVNRATGALVPHDGAQDSQWSRPPAFPDRGGGLVSTVDD